MRIEIKTSGKVTDNDVKALFLLDTAMKISTPRMRVYNLNVILDALQKGDYGRYDRAAHGLSTI